MNNMVRIEHNDYSKISDFVYHLTTDWSMRFYVELNKFDDSGKHNYHSEYGYNTKNGYEISIKRDFIYYLSIESSKKDSKGFKQQIKIYQHDMYFLLYKLNNVEKWFVGGNNEVFARKGNQIIIPSKQQFSEKIKLAFGHSIQLEPTVMRYSNNDIIGVRFYLDGDLVNFGITAERFLGLLYLLRNFNMFQSAQIMVNYIGMNYGTNYIQFENNMEQDRYENNKFLNNNYNIKPKQSFFELTGANKRSE